MIAIIYTTMSTAYHAMHAWDDAVGSIAFHDAGWLCVLCRYACYKIMTHRLCARQLKGAIDTSANI